MFFEFKMNKIAYKKSDLPNLKKGYARVVHLSNSYDVDSIRKHGLNYERQGILSSTARWWQNEKEVEYFSDDPRYSSHGVKAIVMDVPFEEVRLHNDISKARGIVPSKYIIGILDISDEKKSKKISKLEKDIGGITAIIGFAISLILFSSNFTGNVIGSNLTSNIIGLMLFSMGLVGAFFYFINRK